MSFEGIMVSEEEMVTEGDSMWLASDYDSPDNFEQRSILRWP
jgi:hypothetical protein